MSEACYHTLLQKKIEFLVNVCLCKVIVITILSWPQFVSELCRVIFEQEHRIYYSIICYSKPSYLMICMFAMCSVSFEKC